MPPKKAAATGKKAAAAAKGADAKKKSVSAAADAKKKKSVAAAAATDVAPPPPPEPPIEGREIWLATDALQKTKAMRNYFQLERDRIIAFWDITKRELEEARQGVREREQAAAELRVQHEVEKKVFKQKIRHLLYENQLQLSALREEGERALLAKEDEFRRLEGDARTDVRDVKVVSREMEIHHRDQRQQLIAQQDREIAEQQAAFEREIKEIHLKNEQMLRNLRDSLDQARQEEIRAIEKRKEDHIAELRETHERTFREMKDYYSEITSNNLETIRTLKDEVYARKRTEAHNEKAMYEVALRNKKLTEPLARLQRQKKDLEQELADYWTNKETLQRTKEEVRALDQEYQSLQWAHEVLRQRHAKLVEDRDAILEQYNKMLQEVQRKGTFRRVLVQKKLELVQNQLEGRDAKLTEILKRANVNPEDMRELEQKVHDLISEKDRTIEDLKTLLIGMTARGEDIVNTYESYLANNGVSGLAAGGTAAAVGNV